MRVQLGIGALGAAALLGLALAHAATVLPGCGLRLGPLGDLDFCVGREIADPSSSVAAELERHAALADRLRRLERRLAGLAACPLPGPGGPESSVLEREVPDSEAGSLDPARWRERDASLLEGFRSLASAFSTRNIATGAMRPVDTWQTCFDAEGRGRERIILPDGDACAGTLSAAFQDDGQVRIAEEADVPCTGGGRSFRRIAVCALEPNREAERWTRQPAVGSGVRRVRIPRRVSL